MEKKKDGVTLSRRTLVILAVVILLLVAGSVIVGLNWNRWFGEEPETAEVFSPEIDPDAADWDGQSLNSASEDETESVGIQIPGYPSITIPADEETVSLTLLNPEGNPCYFTFALVLKDTEEVLYTSGLVPPGQAIKSITLSRALEAGEYDAVIQITTTSLTDGSAMNGANVETLLIVK